MTLVSHPWLQTSVVDGRTYYTLAVPADDWDTGPCGALETADERLAAWIGHLEIPETAPGQLSRREMRAVLTHVLDAHLRGEVLRDGGALVDLLVSAIAGGPRGTAWIRASALVTTTLMADPALAGALHVAGGTRIRRGRAAVPTTEIPVRVLAPDRISVDLVLTSADQRYLILRLLGQLGTVQDLGHVADEVHVLVDSAPVAIAELVRLCAGLSIEIRQVLS